MLQIEDMILESILWYYTEVCECTVHERRIQWKSDLASEKGGLIQGEPGKRSYKLLEHNVENFLITEYFAHLVYIKTFMPPSMKTSIF